MYSLPKQERIRLKKEIDELFTQGKGFVAYPLRCVYLLRHESEALQQSKTVRSAMMVSVGKRYFKRANKRNRVKRLIRETYRLSKPMWLSWLEAEQKELRIAFMFVGKELPEYRDIEKAMHKAFTKISTVTTSVQSSNN